MAKKTRIYGKPVAHYEGYHIRPMLNGKLPNGKFGVFAGKNKIEEGDSVSGAIGKIGTLKK